MRATTYWNIPALLAGMLAVGSLGTVSLVLGQEGAAPKVSGEDPFKDTSPQEKPKEDQPRLGGGHQITLHERVAEGKTLEERLEVKGTLVAVEAPLGDLPEMLSTALDAPVTMALKKLEEASIDRMTPVSYRLRNIKLKTGLKLLLEEIGLTYMIQDDALVITIPEDAASHLHIRVYDCRDLCKLASPVKKPPSVAQPRLWARGEFNKVHAASEATTPAEPPPAEPKITSKEEVGPEGGYTIQDLVDLMGTNAHPESWESLGGPGSIKEFKGLVVITQTDAVHAEVEKLLNLLHKAAGLEERVKVSR